jgi:Na+/phosphate symporter
MTTYIIFSLLFFVIHIVCYTIAGVIDFQFAKKMYSGKNRLYKSFFRDMDDEKESKRIARLLIPSQFIRAIVMSIVLYPILPFLGELSFRMQLVFMASLMFVYADFASAIPFSNTIEGIVYLKKEFVEKRVFWTIQFEAILYSIMFGLLSAWFLL